MRSNAEKSEVKKDRLWLAGLILLHLIIALPLAFYLNIWIDEASTLHTTQNGLRQAFQNVFNDEKQAPLYFLILSGWRSLNGSIFFARLFSVLCSAAAIAAFNGLARKMFARNAALLLTAIFALHPYLFWASLEIRLYSFVILLSCLLYTFLHEGFLRGEADDARAQNYFTLTAIAALYTNYYLGFPLVGAFAALLVTRHWRAARSYFWRMLVVGAAITPLLWIISVQFADRAVTFQPEKSLVEGLRILWNHFLIFVLPTEIFPGEQISLISTVRLWLVRVAAAAVMLTFIKNKFKNVDQNMLAFGTISAVCAAFFLFIYFRLGGGYVEIRHAAIYFVPLVLFVGAVLIKVVPQKLWAAAIILYAVFFVYAVASIYPNLTKRGDWAHVAEYIERSEKPNQPIVSFPIYEAVALPFYYHGRNEILPDEKFFEFFLEDEIGSPNSFRRQIEFVIGKIPAETAEIWLLTSDKCAAKQACEPLENFVRANYTVIEEKDFYKEKVRLLRKKSND